MAGRYRVMVMLVLLAALLAGCGDSTPTVPVTPKELALTTTPDSTVLPSRATTPSPLASPQIRPTAGNSNPNPTTAPPVALTSTNGLPVGPTPTSDARAVPIAQSAVTQMQSYKSYHFTVVTTDTSQTTTIEGDYVAPDRLSVRTSLGGTTVQQIIIGSDVYLNSGSGWAKSDVDASTLVALAKLWSMLLAVNGVTLVGDEQIGGTAVTHLRASAAVADTASIPGGQPGQPGSLLVDTWVGKSDNAVLRINLTTSVAGQVAYQVVANYSDFNKQVTIAAPTP